MLGHRDEAIVKCVFIAFEKTRDDPIANVASLGFDLAQRELNGELVLDHVNVQGRLRSSDPLAPGGDPAVRGAQ